MASITLLSDFGLHDATAGMVKGILLSTIPTARILDISHEVTPYDTAQAAYMLRTAYGSFPDNTVHLILVDIFSEAIPKLVLGLYNGQYFIAPDNGIIPLTLNNAPANSWLCFELTKEKNITDWLQAAANVIKRLHTQSPIGIELPHTTLKTISTAPQPIPGNQINCNVVYIDNFGNVVTDMTTEKFSSMNTGNRFTLRFMLVNEITTLSHHYNDVRQGEHLCRFNHNGHLEICVNKGNAANLFGFRAGGKRNDIKITFE